MIVTGHSSAASLNDCCRSETRQSTTCDIEIAVKDRISA